ncbi:MAG TPA: winged helix-turn-helix domain-containing protein [Terracidiphilus sp.]|nr:winged helix-turn-helix domain-containing protein [Terracidiphilus sp.]
MAEHKSFIFKFEGIVLRESEFAFARDGRTVSVEPTAFRVLIYLLRNPGRLVTKDEIMTAAWRDAAVSDNSLTRSIATLRRLLGDDSREPRFIATVPTVGYRFLCEVTTTEEGGLTPEETHLPPAIVSNDRHNEDLQLKPQFDPARKRLSGLSSAALCILAVGFVVAGFLIRQAASTRDAHRPVLAHLSTEERITSNPPEAPVEAAVVSRDGKYLAFHDNSGLYLRQIASSETRAWSLPKDFDAWPDDWFPDNIHLLVTRREGVSGTLSLWTLSLLGSEPKKLIDDAAQGAVSPDGSRIAYSPGPKFGSELWVMDSDGANARRVASARKADEASLGDGWIQRPAWSPNGTHLAYVESHLETPDPPQFANSLLTRDANGGNLQVVLQDDSRLRPALWWDADGRILFSYLPDRRSEREDMGIQSIAMDERTGKAIAPPQPVTEGQGWIGALSATSDGKQLVISRGNTTRQVFITELDPGKHRWKTPRRLTLDINESVATAWTADSKAVLFVSDRSGTWKLFKQNIEELTPEVLVEGRGMRFPRLSADGLHLLYLVESQPGDPSIPASLMSKPLAGGPPRLVLRDNGITNYQCARAPSQMCIFSKLVGSEHILVSFDLVHGRGREITKIPSGLSHWSLSPDGSRLALVVDMHRIRFLAPDTGVAHEVTLNDWPVFNIDWSSDGSRVFVRSVTPAGVPVILALSEAGKQKVVIQGQKNSYFTFFIQSPDGRQGILEMPTPGDNNAWMVRNF